MKRIIYTNQDGGTSIIIPAPAAMEELGFTDYDEFLQYVAQKDVPQGCEYHIVNIEDIPTDRTFRNAWIKDNASVKTDIPKAKLIAHEKRRNKRSEEFAPLDIEATIPSKSQQAEAKRQAIRDKYDTIQIGIDSATTEAELKQILSDGGVL